MKYVTLLSLAFALTGTQLANADTGDCKIGTQLPTQGASNLFVVCESIGELVRNEDGTATFQQNTGIMPKSTPITGGYLVFRNKAGREITMSAPPITNNMTLENSQQTGRALVDAFPEAFGVPPANTVGAFGPPLIDPDSIDVSSVRFKSVEIRNYTDHFVPSKCRFVSKEVRNVNLLRFLTDTSQCTSVGSCLPNKISICNARIACTDDLQFGSQEYNTVCRTKNDQCPTVDECIRDDAVMTPDEEKHEQRRRTTPSSAVGA